MAKNDKLKDDVTDVQNNAEPSSNVEESESNAQTTQPVEQPVAPVVLDVPPAPQAMPVENQQSSHDAAVINRNAALQPGRDVVPAHQGAVGEIESLARKAEVGGDHAIAGILNQLLVKLGDIMHYIQNSEHLLGDDVKTSVSKVSALFKK